MTPIVVSEILAVGEFPSPEQFEILAKAGFKSVINNQPDGEVDRFPGSVTVAALATRHGLGQAYAPVHSRTPSDEELAAFAAALKSLPAPIYAFCYSGARSAAAAAFMLTETQEADAIVAEFGRAGFDIAGLKPWLDEERLRRKPAPGSANGNGGRGAGNGAGNGQVSATLPAPSAAPASAPSIAPATTPAVQPPVAAQAALQGIVVHARAAGYGGFAM